MQIKQSVIAQPSRSLKWVGLLGLSVVAVLGGWSVAARNLDTLPAGIPLSVSGLDFGTVTEGPKFVHRVKLQNTSAEVLHITGLSASCNCVAVRPQAFGLDPTESAEVDLTLDLMPQNHLEATQTRRHFSVRLLADIETARSSSRYVWHVTGNVTRPFQIQPAAVRYVGIDALVSGTDYKTQSVRLTPHTGQQPLTIDSAECDVAECVITHDGDGVAVIQVTPLKSLQEGSFSGVIRAAVRDADGINTIQIPVEGYIAPDIQIDAALTSFPPAKVGFMHRGSVSLRSFGGHSFKLLAVKSGSEAIEVIGEFPAFSAEHIVIFTAKVQELGTHSCGTLQLSYETSDQSQRHVSVPVQCYGKTADRGGKSTFE